MRRKIRKMVVGSLIFIGIILLFTPLFVIGILFIGLGALIWYFGTGRVLGTVTGCVFQLIGAALILSGIVFIFIENNIALGLPGILGGIFLMFPIQILQAIRRIFP
jgi:hypothetical protein